MNLKCDHLCSLVVKIPGYKPIGSGSDFRLYHIVLERVGLERGPLSLVRIREKLLE
jgi:hypothetical protein